MKLYQNTINGLRYRKWTRGEAIAYFLKGVARELRIFPLFFEKLYAWKLINGQKKRTINDQEKEITFFKEQWLKNDGKESYFDFGICRLPDISKSSEKMKTLLYIFEDVFLFPYFLKDNYDKEVVEYFDCMMREGPYGYVDGSFDVTIKKDDIVIDAGAWIGDYSAYAASKGAIVYAFEPVNDTYQLLCKTQILNDVNGEKICPVQKGLGNMECEMNISICADNSGENAVTTKSGAGSEKISITTLDKFVEENKLEHIDFIKADIEGSERDMLRGAMNVLKNFAPKLAICTYHLPDDQFVLENIIREANPNYTIVHLRHKLFAAVIKK